MWNKEYIIYFSVTKLLYNKMSVHLSASFRVNYKFSSCYWTINIGVLFFCFQFPFNFLIISYSFATYGCFYLCFSLILLLLKLYLYLYLWYWTCFKDALDMDYKKICYTIYATQVKDIYVIRKLCTGQSGMSKILMI